jgi:thiol-disulfide isomerase/thioredoxin
MTGSLATVGPILLSAAEIVFGSLLFFPLVSFYGAIGMAVLLLSFIAMMAYQYAKGNAPDCHCFGQLHSEPVSLRSIARNVVFLALTSILIYRGPGLQGLALQDVTPAMLPIVLSSLSVLMLAGALLYLRKIVTTQSEISRRLVMLETIGREGAAIDHEHATDPHQGLPIGSPLPDFDLTTLDGKKVSRHGVLSESKPVLFFFVSPTCEPCQALLAEFINWREELSDRISIYFVSNGPAEENERKFRDLPVLLDEGRKFALAVGGRWTPTALLVGSDGKIVSHVAAGDLAIDELIEKIKDADLSKPYTFFANGDHHGRGLRVGKEVPEFQLEDLHGNELSRQDLVGKRTLVTFWSPTCPHCAAFLDELKEWEQDQHNGDPALIIFSDGDVDEHRSLGLNSSVVIDRGYKTAGKMGMFGTPSAVLVNEHGIIISETGVGASNIFALIGKQR